VVSSDSELAAGNDNNQPAGSISKDTTCNTLYVRQLNSDPSQQCSSVFVVVFVSGTWLFGTSSPSANIPRADVEPIIRPDLLPSVMVNPTKLEVLH